MADYKTAVLITIDDNHEGGFQKNKNDHANWDSGQIGVGNLVGTKYGITAVDMPGRDIENLTPADAIEFYKGYWKDLYSQIESQMVANKLFDMGVLFGITKAIEVLQATLKPAFPEVSVDGNFGPVTLNAVNQSEENSLLQAYKTSLVAYTLKIAQVKPQERIFVSGWGRRINL